MRDRFLQMLVPAIVALALVVAVRDVYAQAKPPVPAAESQEPARKAAAEIYGERFQQAKTAAEKTALATEMLEAAMKVQDGSPDQYVLLKIAADIAAGAGDAPTALQAVEKMAERFDVPGPKLTAETLLAAAGNASTTSQHKAVGESVLKIADAVAGAEEYKLALDLCETARSSAQKARQYPLAKELAAKIEDFQKRQLAFQEYKAAWALMQDDPAEPAANLTAGRYLCFVKGDWLKGVPMLALGSDAALRNVSLMELRGAKSAEQEAAIGDAWWDAAEARQGEERDMLRLRAGLWYRQAAPQLGEKLSGLKVKQRLAELEKAGRDMSSPPTEAAAPRIAKPRLQLPAGAVLLLTFEPETFTSKDGKMYVADLSGFGNHGIVEGATQTPAGRAEAAMQFGGQDCILLPTLHACLTRGFRQLSISVWVQQADLKGDQFIFDVGASGTRSVNLTCRSGEFVFVLPENHGGKALFAPEKVETSQWYHIVGVWNGAEQRIYVNAQMKATSSTQGLTLNATSVSGESARIGTQSKTGYRSGRFFRGVIDEVAVFPRALSDEEIQTLFQFGQQGEPLVKTARSRSGR